MNFVRDEGVYLKGMEMKNIKPASIIAASLFSIAFVGAVHAGPATGPWIKPDTPAQKIYDEMVQVLYAGGTGYWKLAPRERQIDTTGAHEGLASFLGVDQTLTSYAVIGRGTTLQENFLTGTDREMVTMYYCDRLHTCDTLMATHFCAKRNVPVLKLNFKETAPRKYVFDCDMSTPLCQSNDDHIYRIIVEVSENGQHLKLSYLGKTNQKVNAKHSIFHFDRRVMSK